MKEFLNPNKIIEGLNLKKEMIAVDFGSGSGSWVIPLAKKLEEGKVYAVDLLEEPLSALKARANLEKLYNIQTVLANVEKKIEVLEDNSCDLVLMTNLLFQCEEKKEVLKEGKRVLKPKGRILIVDWREDALLGPKEGRVSREEIEKMTQEIGLEKEKELDAGSDHFAFIFTKE